MKSNAAFPLLSVILFFGCAPPHPQESTIDVVPAESTAPSEDSTVAPLIPMRYQQAWFLPPISRWERYWQQQYAADSTGDLSMRTADLDGDGSSDHVLFLCSTDTAERDSAYVVLVTFGNGRDTLLVSYPWAEAQGGIGMGLALHPPGTLEHLGGEEGEAEIASPVLLTQPAVTVLFFEKAAITWFWRDGSFHQVWTGD
ncbi:MAG: hypothetical protein WAU70_15600 [Flavobacteriales bacterium]